MYSLRSPVLLLVNSYYKLKEQQGYLFRLSVLTISITHDISPPKNTPCVYLSDSSTQLNKNNATQSRVQPLQNATLSIHSDYGSHGNMANISGITCHSNAAFAKQMCLETAVKGFLSLNKNGNKFKTQHTSRVYDYQQFVSLCTDTFD